MGPQGRTHSCGALPVYPERRYLQPRTAHNHCRYFRARWQAWNDDGPSGLLRWQTIPPGVCRGLTANTGGLALATKCYRNRRWIRIANCNEFITRAAARELVRGIDALMPEEGRKRLGNLVDMFDGLGEV